MGVKEHLKQWTREGGDKLDLGSARLSKIPKEVLKSSFCSQVRILTLSNNRINGIHDADIMLFTQLESLNLFGNGLKNIPTKTNELRLLQYLVASNNLLKDIPSGFGSCPSLRVLDLRANKIAELRAHIGYLTNLQELYLCDNKLETLPAEVSNLKSLEVLAIRHNHLTELPEEMGKLQNLETFLVQGNRLKAFPAGMAKCKALKTLELYSNPLHPYIIESYEKGILNMFVFLERPDYKEQLETKVKTSRLFKKK